MASKTILDLSLSADPHPQSGQRKMLARKKGTLKKTSPQNEDFLVPGNASFTLTTAKHSITVNLIMQVKYVNE